MKRLWPLLALGTLPACSRAEPAKATDASTPVVASPSSSTLGSLAPAASAPDTADTVAKMTLLDPGRPPRHKLRYTWRPHQSETLAMDLKTSASTQDGSSKQPEIPLPPVRIVIGIDPREISPEGDLTYAWRVTSTAVQADPQTPSTVADGMRAEVAAIEHLAGTAVVSSRGLSSRVSIDAVPALGSSTTGQMVEQVRQTLRDVAAPFPDEEVGRGARWEKLSRLASRDTRITQTETFTLSELSASTGSLDDLLAQTAPPQPLLAPGHAGEARIESMLASGDGKTSFDLSRLVPQTRFDGTTTMVVSGRLHENDGDYNRGADDSHRMTMMMRVGIVISGGVP